MTEPEQENQEEWIVDMLI